jgi:serine carboxypeptidase-like clade 2
MKMKQFLLLFWVFAMFVNCDPVRNLPGYNGPPLNMDSGYIVVDPDHGRRIFYWLIRSQNNPAEDPLVIWYQGGPGCSGLGGLMSEHGPVTPNMNGGVDYAPISWTSIANVLYLEQPAGVGFSYSDTPSDYTTDDNKSAKDNLVFIEQFLQAHPEFLGRDLWLTGESYAGAYVPFLTALILDHPETQAYTQLRGIMMGNPVIFCFSYLDYNNAQFMLYYYHGLVSQTNYANWTAYGCDKSSNNTGCDYIMNVTLNQIGVIYQQFDLDDNLPSLDPDDLYQDFCSGNGTLDLTTINPNACNPVGSRTAAYLNRADVQAALHVNPTNWVECTNNINYNISFQDMIPYYRKLFKERPDVAVLIYSGDVDIATVPFQYTISCLGELRSEVTPFSPWQPWFVNGATAGYFEVYDQYVYATIKGAGHEAPQYQPFASYVLFERFLTTQTLAEKHKPTPRAHPHPRVLKQGELLRQLEQRAGKRF